MAQRRIFNFGDPLTQDKVKDANAKLLPSIVYDGYDISVEDVDSVSLSPGTLLLPNGIVLQESVAVSVSLMDLLGPDPEDFTVVATHVDEQKLGGVPATYDVGFGFFSSYPNSTIIGWIRYPGGSIDLDASMIIQAPKGPFDNYLINFLDRYTREHNLSPGGGTGTGGAFLTVRNEGTLVEANTATMNFVGEGVTATQTTPSNVQVTIPRSGNTVVLQPGGFTEGNVYNNWNDMYAALNSLKGIRTIMFDGRYSSNVITIPPGSWNMEDVRWVSANTYNIEGIPTSLYVETIPIPRLEIIVPEGVQFTKLRWIEGFLKVIFEGTTPPVADFIGVDTFWMKFGSVIMCQNGPFFEINQPFDAAKNITKLLMFGAELINDGYEVVNIPLDGTLHTEMFDAAAIGNNTFRGVASAFLRFNIGARTVYLKSEQNNLDYVTTPGENIFYVARSPQNKSAEILKADFVLNGTTGTYTYDVYMNNYPNVKNTYTILVSYTALNNATYNITWQLRSENVFQINMNTNNIDDLLRVTWAVSGIFPPDTEI